MCQAQSRASILEGLSESFYVDAFPWPWLFLIWAWDTLLAKKGLKIMRSATLNLFSLFFKKHFDAQISLKG